MNTANTVDTAPQSVAQRAAAARHQGAVASWFNVVTIGQAEYQQCAANPPTVLSSRLLQSRCLLCDTRLSA